MGLRPFDFWVWGGKGVKAGVYGWVIWGKKYPGNWFGGKVICGKEIPGKQTSFTKKNYPSRRIMLEKNLTPSYVAEKKFPQTKFPQTKSLKYPPPPAPPPQKSNVRPLRHVIGENRSHNCAHESEKALLASVSTKGIALETGLNNTVNKTLIHSWLDTISLRMPRSDETRARLYSPAKIQWNRNVWQVMLVYSHGCMEVLLFNRIFIRCSMTRGKAVHMQ